MSEPIVKDKKGIEKPGHSGGSLDQPRLVGSDGQESIITDQFSIGRSSECSLQIEDGRASRRHASLEVAGGQVVLHDLESHNGTWVNEQRITTPAELHDGDQVRIGRTVFTFKAASVPEVEQPPQSSPELGTDSQTRAWDLTIPMTLVRGDEEIGLNRNIRIGRGETNDLVLKGDKSASHSHAKVELVGGKVIIEDLNSNNGTWVNGKRITSPTSLNHGDKIRLGDTVLRLRVGDRPLPLPKPGRAVLTMGAVFIIALGVGLYFLVRQIAGTGGANVDVGATLVAAQTQQAASKQGAIDLAKQSVVFVDVIAGKVTVKNRLASANFSGSGSMFSEHGYVLTNFHVLGVAYSDDAATFGKTMGELYDNQELILIGLNPTQPDAVPNTFYNCEIVAKDPNLDLAVLHVVGHAEVNDNKDPMELLAKPTDSNLILLPSEWSLGPLPADMKFKNVKIGNSDNLNSGDSITVLGFPVNGGNTVTVTNGIVSGFISDTNNDLDRGWIKTDTDINHGNSGGMAIDQKGELIGVPTWGRNMDVGGGSINYVRPINAALNLIRSACPACLP